MQGKSQKQIDYALAVMERVIRWIDSEIKYHDPDSWTRNPQTDEDYRIRGEIAERREFWRTLRKNVERLNNAAEVLDYLQSTTMAAFAAAFVKYGYERAAHLILDTSYHEKYPPNLYGRYPDGTPGKLDAAWEFYGRLLA